MEPGILYFSFIGVKSSVSSILTSKPFLPIYCVYTLQHPQLDDLKIVAVMPSATFPLIWLLPPIFCDEHPATAIKPAINNAKSNLFFDFILTLHFNFSCSF